MRLLHQLCCCLPSSFFINLILMEMTAVCFGWDNSRSHLAEVDTRKVVIPSLTLTWAELTNTQYKRNSNFHYVELQLLLFFNKPMIFMYLCVISITQSKVMPGRPLKIKCYHSNQSALLKCSTFVYPNWINFAWHSW